MEPDQAQAQAVGDQIEEILRELKKGTLLGERLLSIREAAALIGVSPDYAEKLIELGELTKWNIARDSARPMWRVRHSDVLAFIDRVTEQ